jgi:hypothetical protein
MPAEDGSPAAAAGGISVNTVLYVVENTVDVEEW